MHIFCDYRSAYPRRAAEKVANSVLSFLGLGG